MTWICPYCGYENLRDPLNSRDKPPCDGCGEKYITAIDLEYLKGKELIELREMYGKIRAQKDRCLSRIEESKSELSRFGYELRAIDLERQHLISEIQKWENMKLYLEVPDQLARNEKARKDKKQKRILEVI